MQARYLSDEHPTYDGTQLRSLWAYANYGIQGDSVVAWRGPCEVTAEHLVDEEDRRSGAVIRSEEMVHFIAEFFMHDLERAIALQRLLVCVVREVIEERSATAFVSRKGDDLFAIGAEGFNKKLTVSIATASPVSCLIHVGVNVTAREAPVPAMGLNDLGIDPDEFTERVLAAFVADIEGMAKARCKVRGVE